MEKEIWKSIEGYDGLYEVSKICKLSYKNLGRIMAL